MAIWPHQETALTECQKQAYRYLLYRAMVDIRNLCVSRGPATFNPLEWYRQYHRSRLAGEIADWLHNLADYVSRDFQGFDADWFWQEYEGLRRRFKPFRENQWMDYRGYYEQYLARQKETE